MAYQLPGIEDFKAQFPTRIFPYAVPLFPANGGYGAAASLTIGGSNNSVIGAAVTAGGTAYPRVPTVIVLWGSGTGAILTAAITAGVVTGLTIVKPGYGYTDPTTISVYFSPGVGDNTDVKAVTDYDIAKAMKAAMAFNMTNALWGSQAAYTYAYNLLIAHYLCENAQADGAGLGGQADWVRNSKTVGDVTESFSIPERVTKSIYFAKFSKTTFGSQFLELIAPSLIGNFQSYHRCTLP